MKNNTFIRIFAVLTALLMLMLATVGCTGDGEETTGADITTAVPDETTAEAVSGLVIFEPGVGKSEYRIVRPEKAVDATEAAIALRKLLQDSFSVSLDIKDDWYKSQDEIPECEILIGDVNRTEIAEAAQDIKALKLYQEAFTLRAVNKKLVIYANSEAMYDAAFAYLTENFIKDGKFIVPEDLKYTSEINDLEPTPSQGITESGKLNVEMVEVFTMPKIQDAAGNNCRVVQGGCTDGKYYYVCMNNGASAGAVTAILKIDMKTGEVVGKYEGFKLDHSNDMAYNSKTNELVVIHNAPNRLLVSVIDAETMTLKRTKKSNAELYAISYDEAEDCYWVGLAHTYDYAKLDENFRVVEKFSGYNNGFTKQGMDSDDKYVYFVLYKTNCIAVYDKAGNYIRQIDLPVTSGEPEHILHIGGSFYIGYNNSSWSGGILYQTDITPVE